MTAPSDKDAGVVRLKVLYTRGLSVLTNVNYATSVVTAERHLAAKYQDRNS